MIPNCTCGHNLIDVSGVVTAIDAPTAGVFEIGDAGLCPDCRKVYAVIGIDGEEMGFVTFQISHEDQGKYIEMKGALDDAE